MTIKQDLSPTDELEAWPICTAPHPRTWCHMGGGQPAQSVSAGEWPPKRVRDPWSFLIDPCCLPTQPSERKSATRGLIHQRVFPTATYRLSPPKLIGSHCINLRPYFRTDAATTSASRCSIFGQSVTRDRDRKMRESATPAAIPLRTG
jgi:hypothetical protein